MYLTDTRSWIDRQALYSTSQWLSASYAQPSVQTKNFMSVPKNACVYYKTKLTSTVWSVLTLEPWLFQIHYSEIGHVRSYLVIYTLSDLEKHEIQTFSSREANGIARVGVKIVSESPESDTILVLGWAEVICTSHTQSGVPWSQILIFPRKWALPVAWILSPQLTRSQYTSFENFDSTTVMLICFNSFEIRFRNSELQNVVIQVLLVF